eukprot:TRINITY_DN109147_c0_g1_i1.p1 TRINITY_DN109147_c0_g1~~TRINITY_DN109147_c0_g1_i1.p1  ORF type:complete len:107 (-),score=8.54 TRINITY_DN109147_c0_g1_i1:180-500(-)
MSMNYYLGVKIEQQQKITGKNQTNFLSDNIVGIRTTKFTTLLNAKKITRVCNLVFQPNCVVNFVIIYCQRGREQFLQNSGKIVLRNYQRQLLYTKDEDQRCGEIGG